MMSSLQGNQVVIKAPVTLIRRHGRTNALSQLVQISNKIDPGNRIDFNVTLHLTTLCAKIKTVFSIKYLNTPDSLCISESPN